MSDRIRAREAARRLAISLRSIQDMAAKGDILGAAKIDGEWQFDSAKLDAWVSRQETTAAQVKKNRREREIKKAAEKVIGPDVIIQSAFRKRICGIYFLMQADEIVYVGQPTNIFLRVGAHARDKRFNRWNYVICSPDELDAMEQAYIRLLDPKLNRDAETRGRRRKQARGADEN